MRNTLISQAIVHLCDSFNSDDDDSYFELNRIEQYIEQLERETTPTALGYDALYLHCFTTEVLKQLPESTGDLFGIGEDVFIVLLYPFSKLIVDAHDKTTGDGKQFQGVFVYDVMEELAGLFIAAVMRQKITVCATMAYELPELDMFELDVNRVVPNYAQ